MMASVPTILGGAETASASATGTRTQEWRLPEDATRLSTYLRLRNGATVMMRVIRTDDMERLRAFHTRLSPDTIYWRFFSVVPVLSPEMAERLTHVDYENRMALVATTGTDDNEQIVAVVRYDRSGPATAEVAFVVEDAWQKLGMATTLLYRLAAYARDRGIVELVALMMSENRRMRSVLRHSGFPTSVIPCSDLTEVRLDISQPPVPAYMQ